MSKVNKQQDPIVVETLKLVNRIRKFQGKPALRNLPKGLREEPEACPIATAIDGTAGAEEMIFELDGIEVRMDLPQVAESFIDKFDDGKYPQFDLNPEELED